MLTFQCFHLKTIFCYAWEERYWHETIKAYSNVRICPLLLFFSSCAPKHSPLPFSRSSSLYLTRGGGAQVVSGVPFLARSRQGRKGGLMVLALQSDNSCSSSFFQRRRSFLLGISICHCRRRLWSPRSRRGNCWQVGAGLDKKRTSFL